MEEKTDGALDKVLDKILGAILSRDKTMFYLFLIFFLGFVLRFIAATNLGVAADDMHHTLHAVNFLGAEKLTTYDQSAGLWHSFTSLAYALLGVNQLSSRVAALIFGSFSILAIFLLAKEFFNIKIALLAAFFLAIAPFHIKSTVAEMDVMTMFFVLISMFLFVKGLRNSKIKYFAISGIFLGLAIYTKVYPLLFIPSLIIYFVYFNKKNKKKTLTKNNMKLIFSLLVCAFLFAIPTITHNYLLYKDKGFLDLQFTNTLGLGKNISAQYYSWDSFFGAENDWRGLVLGNAKHAPEGVPILLWVINYIRVADPLNFYLGTLGFFMIFFRKGARDYLIFFVFAILFILPFLASINLLAKHYLFLEVLLIPIGSFFANEISSKYLKRRYMKIGLVAVFIFSLFFLGLAGTISLRHFYGKSAIAQAIEFKEENMELNSLIVLDSRIYRGGVHWIAYGRSYLEGTEFLQFLNSQEQIGSEEVPIKTYYIECVPDDCGWGTVKNQQEFNLSMEYLTEVFRNNGNLVRTIFKPDEGRSYFPFISEKNKIEDMNIYETDLMLKPEVLEIAKKPRNWFLYDIGYEPKEKQFDYYQTYGFFDTLLNKIAIWISKFAVFLSLISLFYIVYLVRKDENPVDNNSSL